MVNRDLVEMVSVNLSIKFPSNQVGGFTERMCFSPYQIKILDLKEKK